MNTRGKWRAIVPTEDECELRCRFCGMLFTDERQYYTDHIGPYCRNGRDCIYRERPDIRQRDLRGWIRAHGKEGE